MEALRTQGAAKIENYVSKVVESFPPLRPEQVDRITALLRGEEAGTP